MIQEHLSLIPSGHFTITHYYHHLNPSLERYREEREILFLLYLKENRAWIKEHVSHLQSSFRQHDISYESFFFFFGLMAKKLVTPHKK